MDMSCPSGRRAARKADRRRTILEVAERSFLEHGYAETSMSTIAAELGGSKTTLWSYFPSKEALFTAVLDRMIAEFAQELEEALIPSSGGLEAALGRFGRTFARKLLSGSSIALHRLVLAELDRMPEIAEAFATRGPDRVRERMRGFFADEMAAGRLRPGDALLAARQFLALCQSRFYNDRLLRPAMVPALDPNEGIDAAVATFMAGWKPD